MSNEQGEPARDPAGRWREDLDSWAIPPEILAAAPETPWGYPPGLFSRAAEEALAAAGGAGEEARSPSLRRAVEALPAGGSVLDVGVGGGAASLPLCPPGAEITGVDESAGMLDAFAALAEQRGIGQRRVEGRWPDVAGEVPPADVVVCHHVLYNVGDLAPFVAALTARARRRVVVEITAEHPQAGVSPLWERFWGITRPTRPTAADAAAVVLHLGHQVEMELSEAPPRHRPDAHLDEMVAFTRRRLCLPPDRDDEIAAALAAAPPAPRQLVTLWWPGSAG